MNNFEYNVNLKRKREIETNELTYETYLDSENDKIDKKFYKYKNIALKNYISNNDVIRLSNSKYLKSNDFKFKPDCFLQTGELVDTFVSYRKSNEIKLNVIPENYLNYIQVVLNLFNIKKCAINIVHFIEYENTREIRHSNVNLIENNHGYLLEDKDIYWVIEHESTIIYTKKKMNSNKININNLLSNKKSRFIDEQWIGASKTRNYALSDPCLDYFRAYNILDIDDKPKKNVYSFDPSSRYERNNKTEDEAISFIDFLLINGNNFENNIISKLKLKYGKNFIKICESYESRNITFYDKTLENMKSGMPIIHQAVLYNFKTKTFGCADLLVRSDYLNMLTETEVLSIEEVNIKAPLLDKYHYRVIDIKCSKLHLNTDNLTIRNSSNVKPFKTQIAIYNLALEEMQGYLPDQSYILGNGWIMSKYVNKKEIKKKSNNPFNKLGIIEYADKDSYYYDIGNKAIKWIQEVNSDKEFTHNPPNDSRIYPNMTNKFDGIYHNVKSQMAKKLYEITDIWNCGKYNRDTAFKNNVISWMDPKCNAKILGFKKGKTYDMINKILDFNRDRTKTININKISHNNNNWRGNELTFYVDFETISSYLLSNNSKSNIFMEGDFIFMIGIGWVEPKSNKWNYKCLFTNEISLIEERRIIDEFISFINSLNTKFKANAKIIHWSPAETIQFNKICKRYMINVNLNWYDLLKFFKDNEILIIDALDFSLKTIAKSMHKSGMIETVWDNDITNGLDAMFFAWQEYVKEEDVIYSNKFQDIIKYNEVDCKTTFEILDYLKKNH